MRLWYDALKQLCRLAALALFRFRAVGREHIPAGGGALVLSNHQSHLDPVLVGICFNNRLNYLARDTLFGFAPFRWLIRSLNAIPIDREGLGLAGIKETLRRIRAQEMVLLFPEGTRSPDGGLAPFKPGFAAIARRTGAPLVPVAIAGAYEAWPRRRAFPLPGVICVCVGPPLLPEEFARLDDRGLVEEVERRIHACFARATALRESLLPGRPAAAPE